MDKYNYYQTILTELNELINIKENEYNQINFKVKQQKKKIRRAPFVIAIALKLVWKEDIIKLNEIKEELKFLRKKRRNTKYLLKRISSGN